MASITEIHDRAMQEAARADLARLAGHADDARRLLRAAYESEIAAINKVKNRLKLEPTRSVLYRSAAWLAFECGELREAERLACAGLSGNPPEEIADELREVIERVNFHRHLELHGYVLSEEELQMSLAGKGVMPGMANFKAVTDRAANTIKALYRTAQRQMGHPYQDQIPTQLRNVITPYLSVARAASFAFTIRLAEVEGQQSLSGLAFSSAVVDEFLTCTEFLIQDKIDVLKSRIGSEAYLINFLKLTEKIAPDGHDINMVGFTAIREGRTREVNLTIPQDKIKATAKHDLVAVEPQSEPVLLKGKLLFADAMGAQNMIKILDQTGKKHRVSVPEGLMDDIVGPLWNREVEVEGSKTRDVITLSDVHALED